MENPDKFQNELLKLVNRYGTGCFIANQHPQYAEILNTASFSFVDTGSKKLGITNDHVLRDFEDKSKNDSDVVFYIGNYKLNPFDKLIARSDKSDLATFDFSDIDLDIIQKELSFSTPTTWPPDRPQKEDVITFSGFPGQFVNKGGFPELQFNSVGIIEQVHSVDTEKFTLNRDLEHNDKYEQKSGHIDIKKFSKQGGFSGTLVLQVPHEEKLTQTIPVGIFYEGIDTLSQISYVRHIDYIKADGSLIM